jgi:hypothetical protein
LIPAAPPYGLERPTISGNPPIYGSSASSSHSIAICGRMHPAKGLAQTIKRVAASVCGLAVLDRLQDGV